MVISLLYDNIRNEVGSCMFFQFWKKYDTNFKMISNLASNFINTNNFTQHEKNISFWIFPLNDMQASLPFPSPSQKCPEIFSIKKIMTFNFTKKVTDLEIWKKLDLYYQEKKLKRRNFLNMWRFSKEILLKKIMLGGKMYDCHPPPPVFGFWGILPP